MTKAEFFQAYLFAYLFWLELSLGCLALNLVFHIVSGRWSALIRRPLGAGTATLPWLTLLFVPLLFGLSELYPWLNSILLATDPELRAKTIYLNRSFFIGRAILYFAVWLALGRLLVRERRRFVSPGTLGSVGFLSLGITASFASIDWIMSLSAHWYSTMFGLLRIASQALSGMALCIVVAAGFAKESERNPQQWNDLANLLLTTVMFWAYTSFCQYLISWSGNLPEEVAWYFPRVHGGWQAEIIALALLRFGLPFTLLLFKPLKRNPRHLAMIAVIPLAMHFFEIHWLVAPAFRPERLSFTPLEIVLWIAIGAAWIAAFRKGAKA